MLINTLVLQWSSLLLQRAGKFTSTHKNIKKPTKAVKLRTLPNKLFLQQIVKEKEKRMLLLFQPWKLQRYLRNQGEDKSLETAGDWYPSGSSPHDHDSWAESGVLANH